MIVNVVGTNSRYFQSSSVNTNKYFSIIDVYVTLSVDVKITVQSIAFQPGCPFG